MCGLVFLYDPDREAAALRLAVEAGARALLHRGPDEGGSCVVGAAALASRRLSIIDLGGSHQPMRDASGRFTLVFNGEIYNYRERLPEFRGRWEFRTAGDTELLLAGLVLDGPRFLSRLEGMWGFALWDSDQRRLVLGRDRMGKKPLYYRAWRGGIAVASELPALRATDAGPQWQEDLDSTADYLRYGFQLPGRTAYREVLEVPPGHVLTWTPGGGAAVEPYWQLPLARSGVTRSVAIRSVREALTRAVERRLVADVEVGALLSGGIDSSIVVGILAGVLGRKPKTFTMGFADATFDERAAARHVAQRYGTDHFEDCLRTFEPDAVSTLVLRHVGQPFGDPSILPTALVSKLASSRVKVVLSGDGGDELFGGYQRYLARNLMRWYTRLPRPLRRFAAGAIRALPEPVAHHSRSVLKKAHLFLDIVEREDRGPYVAPALYSHAEFSRLAPGLASAGHAPALPAQLDDLQRMMVADALIYLPQDILAKVDRASMAYSVEARAPFLDSNVVSLAFSLPASWHASAVSGKNLLRAAFSDLLPRAVLHRRKQGFAVPVHAWFRGALGEEFSNLLASAPPEWLDRGAAARLLAEHVDATRDHGLRLWNLYVYLLWRQRPQPDITSGSTGGTSR